MDIDNGLGRRSKLSLKESISETNKDNVSETSSSSLVPSKSVSVLHKYSFGWIILTLINYHCDFCNSLLCT